MSVPKSNHLAIGFYEAVGFTITSEFETTYNGIPVLANVMIRQVGAEWPLKDFFQKENYEIWRDQFWNKARFVCWTFGHQK